MYKEPHDEGNRMPTTTINELLERNQEHVERLPQGYFSDVEAQQRPAAVSVCCSDSRVSQEGMWSVTKPGWLFTPSTIGNVVWDVVDGDRIVDGSVLYPIAHTETEVTIVVGHTGCGAITATLDAVTDGSVEFLPGIAHSIALLRPVIEAGLADARVSDESETDVVNQLVEYNVDQQVTFLLDSEDIPPTEQIFGFVYDLHGAYGTARGRAYLVNANGETDPDTIRSTIDPAFRDHTTRLLPPR